MRVLLCQTPKLTYVQAIELLQRETFGLSVDLALFPEMAMEHPPQCSGQGKLTFENVAFIMLARFAKQKRIWIVLGSVEERDDDLRMYDTCVVLNREGEICLLHRKQSTVSGKAKGESPGVFETEFGMIGLLLGTEVEDNLRWSELLHREPYLILNPARAPMQMDPVLMQQPELQVKAWQRSFRQLERAVERHTRQYACSFARADAPFQDGGAGTSILVEPHRSTLAPRCGVCFCVVDTLHPGELQGRKLPGWRQLTIDERARLSMRDRAVLVDEEVEKGPRYLVWTLRPSGAGGLRVAPKATRDRTLDNLERFYGSDARQPASRRSIFVAPCMTHDGRLAYASITCRGMLLLWDRQLKKELGSSMLGSALVTAVSPWRRNQFIVATSTTKMVTLRIFEERVPIACVSLDSNNGVHGHRNSSFLKEKQKVTSSTDWRKRRMSRVQKLLDLGHMPQALSIHEAESGQAIVVFEPIDSENGPTAKLIDFDEGSVEDMDIYRSGAQHFQDDSEEEEMAGTIVDNLVSAQMIVLRLEGQLQHLLVCLYNSNRLCLVIVADGSLHEQMLLEESASERQRTDVPLACVSLQSSSPDSFHMLISYQSMTLRWWQVSLTQCKLQAHATVTAAITHLAILDWPTSIAAQTPASEKSEKLPSALQTSSKAASSRKIPHVAKPTLMLSARAALSSHNSSREKWNARSVGRSKQIPDVLSRCSSKSRDTRSLDSTASRSGLRFAKNLPTNAKDQAPVKQIDPATFGSKDNGSLLVIGFDVIGGMPVFLARNGRITKVYTCSDHFLEKTVKVEQLMCDGETVSVLCSNGDIRCFEFQMEDDVISLTSVPLDLFA